MAGEGPENWIGHRVKVHLFQAGVPDVDTHVTDLRGISQFGITVNGIPGERVFFYPWNAVRLIELMDSDETPRQQTRQQQQVDPGSLNPVFPRTNF